MTLQEYLELDEADKMKARIHALHSVAYLQGAVQPENTDEQIAPVYARRRGVKMKATRVPRLSLELALRQLVPGRLFLDEHPTGEKQLNLRRSRHRETG